MKDINTIFSGTEKDVIDNCLDRLEERIWGIRNRDPAGISIHLEGVLKAHIREAATSFDKISALLDCEDLLDRIEQEL
jgi:hypothetical protein